MHLIFAAVILLSTLHSLSVQAAELTYVPGKPAESKGLEPVTATRSAESSPDYYRRSALTLKVTGAFPAGAPQAVLEVEYVDRGIGVLQVAFDADRPDSPGSAESDPAYTGASRQAGYSTLDTGRRRRALFLLPKPAFRHRQQDGGDIRVSGLREPIRMRLLSDVAPAEWDAVRAGIPEVASARLRLTRPIQLVVSAGTDTQLREDLPRALDEMSELCPLAQIMGFNGVESYVKWNFVEPERGRFDWSYYDAVVAKARGYGLRWFPLLIVGSAYTLPEWYHASPSNEGFVCLEHGLGNDIQSIFCENQTPFVRAFLENFGRHYESTGSLLGVRLGPSGNYGESQYPAGGNWGYKWQKAHIHIGWWAGDKHAAPHFRQYLASRYPSIDLLNRTWGEEYKKTDEVNPFIPQFAETKRKRKDMVDWYIGAMTEWCERWAVWARSAMPKTSIYQSAGGWGFVESGTDFTDQTKSMVRVRGGIRATNETDSYAQNFYATRMLSSAARFYGVPFGSEPASFGSARGVAARIYNILVNNGEHLFFYFPNILHNDQGVAKWLELAPLLDKREPPLVEVAALYPDTQSKLDDAVFRNLYAFAFNQRVAALRPVLDFDFCSERMVLDGALSRYKALVFLWSSVVEADALLAIDRWVRDGGTVIYPYWSRAPLGTVEDDYSVYNRWLRGDTGRGQVLFFRGDREPPESYAKYVQNQLGRLRGLDPRTRRMLGTQKPAEVYVSVLESGTLAVLNYNDTPARVTAPDRPVAIVPPYGIRLVR